MTTANLRTEGCIQPERRMNVLHRAIQWVAPALIPIVAIALTQGRAGWPQMWATAFGIYFSCKLWVLQASIRHGARFEMRGVLMFVFAWAGMDPSPFASTALILRKAKAISLAEGLLNLFAGIALLLVSPKVAERFGDVVAMWVCVSAYCLVLHFGLLHVIGYAWKKAGRDVEAIMQRPARSASLADFWSRRWNVAFRDVCNTLIVRPTRRLLGPAGAVGLVFVGSGLVHELLMSWPARGGWGLPTAYFTLQGIGLFFERSRLGKRIGLSRGSWQARVWTAFVVIAPLPLLVHRPFAENVVIPFFRFIGAI